MSTASEILLSTKDIATRLKISERHAKNVANKLPRIKIGACVRFRQEDLEAYIAAQRMDPAA